MIAVSIVPQSQRLAMMDMEAAVSRGAGLVELRLDRLRQVPELRSLLASKKCPVIVSCRRPQDGGHWQGDEAARLKLLRQAAEAGADYVEIELDCAPQVPRSGKAKRIISVTSLAGPVQDLQRVRGEARTHDANVLRVAMSTPTLEQAWPLLDLLARQDVPTVGVGFGPPGLMVAVLAARLGAPWNYAVLEKGGQTFPGQPTLHELSDILRLPSISPTTPLIAVTEISEFQLAITGALNAAFDRLGLKQRCVPLELGELAGLARAAEAFHVAGMVIGASHQSGIFELLEAGELLAPPTLDSGSSAAGATDWLDECEELARLTRHADLLLRRRGEWAACHTIWRPAVEAIFSLFQQRTGSPRPLAGRRVLLLGTSAVARAIAHAVRKQAATVEVSGGDGERVRMMAEFLGCRPRPLDRLHLAQFHVLVCTEPGPEPDGTWPGLHEALRDNAAVLDISRQPCETALLREAAARGCVVLDPLDVLLGQVDLYVQALTGQQPTVMQLVESAAMLKEAATAAPPPASVERTAAPVAAPPEPPSPVLRALEEDQPGGGKSSLPASSSLRDVLPYLADAGASIPQLAPLSPEEEMPVHKSAHADRQPLAAPDTYGVDIKESPPPPPPPSRWWIIRAGRLVINWVWLGWVMLLVAATAYAAVWLWAQIMRILFP